MNKSLWLQRELRKKVQRSKVDSCFDVPYFSDLINHKSLQVRGSIEGRHADEGSIDYC